MPANAAQPPRLDSAFGPLTVDTNGAAKLAGVSPSHLFALLRTGRFGPAPIRLGRCRRYLVKEIEAWLEAGAPSRDRWNLIRPKRKPA